MRAGVALGIVEKVRHVRITRVEIANVGEKGTGGNIPPAYVLGFRRNGFRPREAARNGFRFIARADNAVRSE